MEMRYFFHIQAPNQYHGDDCGTLLPDDEAARACAISIIEEVRSEYDLECRGWVMIVCDSDDRIIFSIPFILEQ
jgi:hypothetical protein